MFEIIGILFGLAAALLIGYDWNRTVSAFSLKANKRTHKALLTSMEKQTKNIIEPLETESVYGVAKSMGATIGITGGNSVANKIHNLDRQVLDLPPFDIIDENGMLIERAINSSFAEMRTRITERMETGERDFRIHAMVLAILAAVFAIIGVLY
jgi:hypothetical protein